MATIDTAQPKACTILNSTQPDFTAGVPSPNKLLCKSRAQSAIPVPVAGPSTLKRRIPGAFEPDSPVTPTSPTPSLRDLYRPSPCPTLFNGACCDSIDSRAENFELSKFGSPAPPPSSSSEPEPEENTSAQHALPQLAQNLPPPLPIQPPNQPPPPVNLPQLSVAPPPPANPPPPSPLPLNQPNPQPIPPAQLNICTMATQMPFPDQRGAPEFNPKQLRSLIKFFQNLENWFQRAGITDDKDKKATALWYVNIEIANAWEMLDIFTQGISLYAQWKTEVIKLYPGADEAKKFTWPELETFVQRWHAQGIKNIGDWSEFYREFRTSAQWLICNNKLSTLDCDRLCWMAIDDGLQTSIQTRLSVKYPDVHPQDGYGMEQINEAVTHIFYSTSATPSVHYLPAVTQSHTPARQAEPIKLEQAELVIKLFTKALKRYGS